MLHAAAGAAARPCLLECWRPVSVGLGDIHNTFRRSLINAPSRLQKPSWPPHASMLLAGSYERFLFGLRVSQVEEASEQQQQQLARFFTHAAHKGVVKCVVAAGQYAATGGADDLIHLYDLKNDKDLGFLMSPGEGAVTTLTFFAPAAAYNPTHLLSGSADGTLSVWAAGGGWECMKTMRGHRKDVSSISVHPSGLVALSVSRDCSLRMWDLVKGRCTYTTKLEAEAEAVAFSSEDGGERYALLCGGRVLVHSVHGEQGVLATLSHPRRVLCMAWAPGNHIVTGCEDGSLRLWDAQAGVELVCISRAHASRVRALALVHSDSSSSGSGDSSSGDGGGGGGGGEGRADGSDGLAPSLLVATCSSDGSVKLWNLSKAAAAGVPSGASGGACLAEAQTRARLTCLAATDSLPVMKRRLAAAAAVRQQQARAAAAAAAAAAPKKQHQQGQQQQQQGAQGLKRKGKAQAEGEGGGGKKSRKQAVATQQQQQQQQSGSGGKAKDRVQQPGGSGKHGKHAAAAAAAAGAGARDGVVVRGGVVEFLDSPEQAKRQQKKQAVVQQKSRMAAEKGKRYRSVPGEKPEQPPPAQQQQQQQQQRRRQRQGGSKHKQRR